MLKPLEDYQYRLTVPAEFNRVKFCAKASCPAEQCVECSKKRKKQSFQEKLRASLTKK